MKRIVLSAVALVAFTGAANMFAMASKVESAIKSGKYTKTMDDLAAAADDKARQALIAKRGLPFKLADYNAWATAQAATPTAQAKVEVAAQTGPTIDDLYAKAEQAKTVQEIHGLKSEAAAKGATPVQIAKFNDLAKDLEKKLSSATLQRPTKGLPTKPGVPAKPLPQEPESTAPGKPLPQVTAEKEFATLEREAAKALTLAQKAKTMPRSIDQLAIEHTATTQLADVEEKLLEFSAKPEVKANNALLTKVSDLYTKVQNKRMEFTTLPTVFNK